MIVTAGRSAHSIGYVPACDRSPRQPALTKRRAVDFCRVSTAICPAAALPRLP